MDLDPIGLIAGGIAGFVILLVGAFMLNAIVASPVAPQPGDPFYGAQQALTSGYVAAVALFLAVPTVGFAVIAFLSDGF